VQAAARACVSQTLHEQPYANTGEFVQLLPTEYWNDVHPRDDLLTRIGRGGSGSVRSRDRLVGQGDDMATERHHEASPH
jgi:hypothetical protein